MRKKLLFVIPGLSAGGGEKSLVNLLSQIDYKAYEVDLFLFHHHGLFMEFLPPEVNVLPLPETHRDFALPLAASIRQLVRRGRLRLALARLRFAIGNARRTNAAAAEQYNWRHVRESLVQLDKHYDAAIGFLEKSSNYFIVDMVSAARKIGWVHIDYDKMGMDAAFDRPYFEQLDHIVTVSEECGSVLQQRFPEQQHKVRVIYNIVSPTLIRQLAEQSGEPDVYSRSGNETVILSIGRLHEQKGFELAIEACRQLVDCGRNVRWYVIGEGSLREKLEEQIRAYGMERYFILLGLRSNPYPYVRQADIYAQTSRYEGKSIAIDEAKIIGKPILVTNFSTARDQIADGENGIIVDMDPDGIAEGLARLIDQPELRSRLQEQLASEKLGTEEEIHRLYALLEV